MAALFAIDSPLMRGLSRLADLIVLNLLFIATSLPLVTLGASLSALNFTAMRIATDQCDTVVADYVRSFRRNFWQGMVIEAVLVLFAAALAAWFEVITAYVADSVVELLALALWYIIAFGFATTVVFVFPYLANFEGRTREVLRNARLLSWKHPLTSLATMVLLSLCIIVTMFYPQVTAYGMLWLMIGFAGFAAVTGRLFARVFRQYAPMPGAGAE